ncbi:ATP-binding protein [Solimicrobium silvestre]|uniref:P-loop containing region of AAA domain n=1 Tax=Solimicrobium silvestre TaxID=2099400 RepID=A0A2S9GXI7_9BURK|nr:ATP-binding protein [Solimicrobium silvestre]PRC92420.1 P-loop containing region of AAA domain [Solimicrobium silvestre]
MFHIKSLELVHWDYWQRIKNIPLDAKIITISGQNGSGKTTLLDALRTLFGLDCSMGRTYKHYARHSGQPIAWLRAVVDNKPVGRQLSNRPFRSSGFFSEDEVTLFCQIQKNGGDWKRQYLMRPGCVEIEEVVGATDWLGVETYRKRLASAGLSPAMAKVLALEQGETDKLCEYAPRQLLDLVFQVFGDKEVLDAYDEAKQHQHDTELELQQFEAELDIAQSHLEGLRLRVANYHQWDNKNSERRDLQEQILPSLQYFETKKHYSNISQSLRSAKQNAQQQDQQLSAQRAELAEKGRQFTANLQQEGTLEQEEKALQKRLSEINTQLKPQENLLEQKQRLEKLTAVSGTDIAEITQQLEQQETQLAQQKQQRAQLTEKISEQQSTIAALQSKTGLPDPENVRSMRRTMADAKIAHVMLADVVEVSEPRWQGAVEGVLKSFSYVMLLENASDAPAAFKLAEQQRYPHFIVPERVAAPKINGKQDASLLAVVQFSAPVPSWLIDQLKRIQRVDTVAQGMQMSGAEEWITPEAFHSERRGGRSLFVDVARYRFGQAGRAQRLDALQKSCLKLEQQEDQLTLDISKLASNVSNLKTRLAGVDAAKELHARIDEFAEASRNVVPLKKLRTEVGSRLGELGDLLKQATVAKTRSEIAWQEAQKHLSVSEQHCRNNEQKLAQERSAQAQVLKDSRHTWSKLPAGWRKSGYLNSLVEKYDNARQVELRLKSLQQDILSEEWETDATVVDQHHRLHHQLAGQQAETEERRYQNNRAMEATSNARGAYIERLRYTIKIYAKNIKQLGELAGIEVHADPVRLENDDVQLAQAGLHVKFKFDGKGVIGMNDGEASGGQQVMKSLILLIGLLKSEEGSGGFVFIDEPFAHLDIRNIQLVGEFLKNTDAQYLMTTPLTHNTDVYDPSELTLITSKKKKEMEWAQPIFVLQRRPQGAAA